MSLSYTIFIASSSLDSRATHPVAKILKKRGHRPLFFETDKIIDGSAQSTIRISTDHHLDIQYGDDHFSSNDVDAAWFRRPSMFVYERDDRALGMSLEQGARSTFENIWDFIPAKKWLNAPADITRAQRKLPQFAVAQSLDFKLPGALLTNSWDSVRAIGEDSIMKQLDTAFLERSNADVKLFYTTRLDSKKIDVIEHTTPFPGIFEPYIDKKREWRITIVGDQVFSAAIYTEDSAKDDWRKHQGGEGVVFKDETPADASIFKKCHELLAYYNLRYGAFDFIETQDGEMVFLEVNPNGQYMWLEQLLHFPISEAIAAELIAIASTNKDVS